MSSSAMDMRRTTISHAMDDLFPIAKNMKITHSGIYSIIVPVYLFIKAKFHGLPHLYRKSHFLEQRSPQDIINHPSHNAMIRPQC